MRSASLVLNSWLIAYWLMTLGIVINCCASVSSLIKKDCNSFYLIRVFWRVNEIVCQHTEHCPGQSKYSVSSVQFSHCHVRLFATPWTAACQASLSITNSRSLPKLMSIESVMPSNHLILCYPLLLPSIFPSIRVFSNESALRTRWPKYWSFSFNISPSNEYPGLIFRMDWLESSPTPQFKSINS